MAGMSFGGAMDFRKRMRESQDEIARFNADSQRIASMRSGQGGGGADALAYQQAAILKDQQNQAIDAKYGHAAMNAAHTANVAGRGPGAGVTGQGSTFSNAPASSPLPQSGGVGQTSSLGSPSLQTPSALDGSSFEDQSKPFGLREGGFIERIKDKLGVLHTPKSNVAQQPAQDANRIASTFGGLSGEAARSIRARPRQIEEELKRQGLKRGTAFVKDKGGKGSPVKDTVDAKLAEGEAVLNAGAAEMLGRDEIERLNAEGAAKMGLRGGAKMVDGVMHAAAGYSGLVDMRNFDEEAAKAQIQQAANNTALGGMTVIGSGGAGGKGLKGLFTRAPKVARVAPTSSSTFTGGLERLVGDPALLQGALQRGAGKAVKVIKDNPGKTIAGLGTAGAMGSGLYNGVDLPEPKVAQTSAPAEIPVVELSGSPSAYEQGMRAQVEARKTDNAEFSKFFDANGITDEMRANPAQAGLRRVNVPGSTDRIYQRGKNEFVGMGAPSRIAAETARANDPAVQKAAQMKELYTLATQGNEQAGETLRQIIKADSDREVEGLRAQATVQAAGAKGSGKKGSGEDGGLKLAEQFKYAEGARGEDDQMSMLRGLDERKRGAWTELQAEFDNPKTTPERKRELEKKWAQIEQGAYTQDNLAKTDLLLGAKQAGADNTATGMATKYGLLGGVATGLGALYALRKGNLAPAKAALAGLLGGGASAAGGYMYGGGSQGVDENSDLYDIESMNLTADGKKITNGSQTIAFDSLPPQVQRLFLQKRLSQQRQ